MSNKTTNTTETKVVKRGRPTVAGSKRQAVLAMRQAKRDSGIEIKRGRPAGTGKLKIDPSVEVVLKVKESKAAKQAKLKETVAQVPTAGKKLVARNINKNVAVITMEEFIANMTDEGIDTL